MIQPVRTWALAIAVGAATFATARWMPSHAKPPTQRGATYKYSVQLVSEGELLQPQFATSRVSWNLIHIVPSKTKPNFVFVVWQQASP